MKAHKDPNFTERQLLIFWQQQLKESTKRPWLAALLLQRGQETAARFQIHYQRLLALPRRWRRILSRRLSMGLAGAALMLALSGTAGAAPRALAAPQKVIVVDEVNGAVGCKLSDAIASANTGSAPPGSGCQDGDAGLDTIEIQANVNLSSPMTYISSDININANGYTIDGGGAGSVFVISSGNVTIKDATITGGSSLVQGGGIDAYGTGTLIVEDSVITGNSSPYGSGIFGGEDQTVKIYDSTISTNSFSGYGASQGGGIFTLGPTTVERSTISGNEADYGGGVGIADNVVTISKSTISGNEAVYDGGGLHSAGSDVTVSDSTFSGNSAEAGGGLYFDGGIAVLTNSTISGNTAGTGGGLLSALADVTLSNTTVTGNESTEVAYYGGGGGGISVICQNDLSDTVTLQRSIISGNSAQRGSEIDAYYCAYGVKSGNYNIIGHNGADYSYYFNPYGSDVVPDGDVSTVLNPTLQNNGGWTYTHNLATSSPAIDIVPNDQSPTVDQRGAPRPYNDPNTPPPANNAPLVDEPIPPISADSGAVEYGSAVPSAVTIQSLSAAASAPAALPAAATGGLLAASLALWHRMRRSAKDPA